VDRSKLIRVAVIVALATAAIGALAALGALAFIKSGLYNVGAAKPHTRFTFFVTNETMIHSVRRHARNIAAPPTASPAQVVRGFCAYEAHCVACHGAAAVARRQWAGGMEPQPPYLLDAADKFRPRELFWIVKNGIKMTGMPSWRDSMSDEQIWSVVGWLEAARQLPPQTYVRWRSEGRCSAIARAAPAPGPLSIPRP
jgi:mono/diheme cytochrome c family protein